MEETFLISRSNHQIKSIQFTSSLYAIYEAQCAETKARGSDEIATLSHGYCNGWAKIERFEDSSEHESLKDTSPSSEIPGGKGKGAEIQTG